MTLGFRTNKWCKLAFYFQPTAGGDSAIHASPTFASKFASQFTKNVLVDHKILQKSNTQISKPTYCNHFSVYNTDPRNRVPPRPDIIPSSLLQRDEDAEDAPDHLRAAVVTVPRDAAAPPPPGHGLRHRRRPRRGIRRATHRPPQVECCSSFYLCHSYQRVVINLS